MDLAADTSLFLGLEPIYIGSIQALPVLDTCIILYASMVIIKESSIESFEHGSLISLSAEGQYISCGVVPYRKTVLNLVLRPHSNEWEQFRLCKGSDSTSFSLQHHGGGYVSPVNGHDGSEWMCRESVSTWEHLRFEVASHDDNNLIHTVLISCVIDGDIRYLNCTPVREGDRVTFKLIVSSVATPWVIKLVAVPSINVLGLQLGNASVWGQVDARSLCVGDRIRGFVLKVLRALLEVGAFYVVGHGLKSDLFQLCQSSLYGNRPYAEDAVSGTDSTFKKNHRLFDTREGFESESMKVLMPLGLARNELQDVIQQYFDDAESLSNGILHAMSAAQIFAQNVDRCEVGTPKPLFNSPTLL